MLIFRLSSKTSMVVYGKAQFDTSTKLPPLSTISASSPTDTTPRQLIGTLILRVTAMALDPVPFHLRVAIDRRIQALP